MDGLMRLTDGQWTALAPHLPKPAPTGRPRTDDRRCFDAILHVLRTGGRWGDLPAGYGIEPKAAQRRLRDWQERGVWTPLWSAFLTTLDAAGRRLWTRAFLAGAFVPYKRNARF
jgi:transposase